MKIFLVMTSQLALAAFRNRKDGYIPVLNDNLGDTCHMNLADAIKAGLEIAESLDVRSRDVAIVHVEYDNSLHETLAFQGHINGTAVRDHMQHSMWSISKEAAARLNREAKLTIDIYPLPLEVKQGIPTSESLH